MSLFFLHPPPLPVSPHLSLRLENTSEPDRTLLLSRGHLGCTLSIIQKENKLSQRRLHELDRDYKAISVLFMQVWGNEYVIRRNKCLLKCIHFGCKIKQNIIGKLNKLKNVCKRIQYLGIYKPDKYRVKSEVQTNNKGTSALPNPPEIPQIPTLKC